MIIIIALAEVDVVNNSTNPQTVIIKEYFVEVCSNTTLMLSMISYDIYLLLSESN